MVHCFSLFIQLNNLRHNFKIIYRICNQSRLGLKCDGTRAENRFRLSPKRTGPFKSAGASVQSTAGNRGVRINVSYAGYTTFRGSVRVLAIHSIRQFPLHFPSCASPCAIRFQMQSTKYYFTLILNFEPAIWTLKTLSFADIFGICVFQSGVWSFLVRKVM